MTENVHKKHRERVREEFLEHGFNMDTPKHKIMEMLLFYGIAQKDTNEIAHRLVKHFDSIEAILEASPQELQKIDGIGPNCTALIKLVQFISEYYLNEKKLVANRYYNHEEICDFILKRYLGCKNEVVAVTSLDNSGKYLGFDIIGEGDVGKIGISIRKVMEAVLKRNASKIILSHNHPVGLAIPSSEDIEATISIMNALAHVEVEFFDHVIVDVNDYVSMRQSYQYRSIITTDEL